MELKSNDRIPQATPYQAFVEGIKPVEQEKNPAS
jgi:hypothetical protein